MNKLHYKQENNNNIQACLEASAHSLSIAGMPINNNPSLDE